VALEFDHLGPGDYDRAKRVLNRARHPGFVGRELYFRCATTGAAVIAREVADDLGVALIAKQKLQALSVVQAAQGRGVGAALVAHTAPKWVNAIMERVPWFEKRGYRSVGAPRVGQSGKMATQLMELAGEAPSPSMEIGAVLPPRETVPESARIAGSREHCCSFVVCRCPTGIQNPPMPRQI
jgi:GNAT superfamily N-acetyltransferase